VRTIQTFRDEIVRAMSLGADYLIVHPGSARDGNTMAATSVVAESLRQSARGINLAAMDILIENTAGMGNSLGAKIEELAAILNGVPELDLGVCLDTAHLFQAGYSIHTEEGLEQTLQLVERTVGLDRVMALHVNDSKTLHGSRVDRHEHIGRGKIGLEALERLLRHQLLSPRRVPGRAFLLETPIDEPGDDRRNVAALWKLVGVAAEQVPDAEDGFSMLAKVRKVAETGRAVVGRRTQKKRTKRKRASPAAKRRLRAKSTRRPKAAPSKSKARKSRRRG
jgi:deoxyribonuclease-4